jgi:alpha-tubulin suppressor-like RCC1 family protein
MYYWGCGEYGVSGDVKIKNCSVPTLSEYFKYFHEVEKMKVKKMKSCGFFSIALMNNGYLYGWGSNNSGQIGIKS